MGGGDYCIMKSRVKANTTRFSAMDTEAEAYWLGFLFTDGCLSGDKIVFNIAGVDADHLDKLATFLESPRTAKRWINNDGFPRATFTLTSFLIADSLRNAGMHENKTWTVTPWSGPAHLMRHFWRGCVDGDGSIHRYSKPARGVPRTEWRLHFCGNETMVNGFRDYVFAATGIMVSLQKQGKAPSGNQLYCVQYAEKRAAEVVGHLYEGAAVALERKVDAVQNLQATRLERKGVVQHSCSSDGCQRLAESNGMCNAHWRKAYRAAGRDKQRSNYTPSSTTWTAVTTAA